MVSGWDKSPGPDNDYASKPLAVYGKLFLLLVAVGIGALTYSML